MIQLIQKIDKIIELVNQHAEPSFQEEINSRQNRNSSVLDNPNLLLKKFAELIAYSNQAKSAKVNYMLQAGTFNNIFSNFDVDIVANMNPNEIINQHWKKHTTPDNDIKWIRLKSKINAIIDCAIKIKSIINQQGSFKQYIGSFGIPTSLNDENGIDNFWESFYKLVSSLKNMRFPYYSQITTLLHFLSDIGYPCNKPDSVVLKVSKYLGVIVPVPRIRINKKGKNDEVYSDELKMEAIRFIQKYCIQKEMKPAVVDLYYLIYGGQTDAKKYVIGFTPFCNLD